MKTGRPSSVVPICFVSCVSAALLSAEQLGKLLHRHAVLTHHADDVGVLQLTNLLFQLAVAALQIGDLTFVLLQLPTELHDFRVHIVHSPLRQALIAVEMGLPIA